MVTLLIATRNAHKVGEIRAILGEGFRYLTLDDLANPPEVTEDGNTFAANAMKKSVALAKWFAASGSNESSELSRLNGKGAGRVYVLADDSGLEVDALGGAPGVHSARFAALDTGQAGNSSTSENNTKLLRLLKDVPLDRRTARFHCVLALMRVLDNAARGAPQVGDGGRADRQTLLFDGTCEGRIGFAPRGQGGFGYDPLFIPNGYDQTFAELGEEVKNRLSHRARALLKLKKGLGSVAEKQGIASH